MTGRVSKSFMRRRTKAFTRLLTSTILAVAALTALAVPVLACDISVEPSNSTGAVGDTLTFTITAQQTHRTCTVPIEDTQIYLSGMELVSETSWQQISDMADQKEITVELTVAGEGLVEVVRVCSKGGDQCVARVTITPAVEDEAEESQPAKEDEFESVAVPASPSGTDEPPAADEPGGEVEAETGSAPSSVPSYTPAAPESPSFGSALGDALREPYIIALIVLMAVGTVAIARGYRRWRPFALLFSLGFLGFYIGGCPCPIGALQNAFIHFRDVTGHMIVYLQLAIVVVMTLLVGRVFCGWACPMGATQYFLYRKEGGKKPKAFQVSPEWHNTLRWMKYGVLLALMGLVILTQQPVFEDIDPFKVLFNLDFRWGLPLVFLIVLLAVSIFTGFPFCKYLCPLGAFLGLLQPLSLFKIRFTNACTNCGICYKVACDHGAIQAGETCPTINQMECVRCGECISKCPSRAIKLTAKRQ